MVYLQVLTGGPNGMREMKTIILLERKALEDLMTKEMALSSPDGRVLLGYMPDPAWTAAELDKCQGSTADLTRIIAEGTKRPYTGEPLPENSFAVVGQKPDGSAGGQIARAEGLEGMLDLLGKFNAGELTPPAPDVPPVHERKTRPSAN